jgi:hypothetical protein
MQIAKVVKKKWSTAADRLPMRQSVMRHSAGSVEKEQSLKQMRPDQKETAQNVIVSFSIKQQQAVELPRKKRYLVLNVARNQIIILD